MFDNRWGMGEIMPNERYSQIQGLAPNRCTPGYVGMPNLQRVSKKEMVNTLAMYLSANEVVLVDDFDSDQQRHVCMNGTKILVLNKSVYPIQLPQGFVHVEYFMCPYCRKLIINKLSLEVL